MTVDTEALDAGEHGAIEEWVVSHCLLVGGPDPRRQLFQHSGG